MRSRAKKPRVQKTKAGRPYVVKGVVWSPELARRVQADADSQRRSFSAQVVMLVERAYAAEATHG